MTPVRKGQVNAAANFWKRHKGRKEGNGSKKEGQWVYPGSRLPPETARRSRARMPVFEIVRSPRGEAAETGELG
jgi:hypothetical protein